MRRKKDNDAGLAHALAVDSVCAARHYKMGTGARGGNAGHCAVRGGYRSVVNYGRTQA